MHQWLQELCHHGRFSKVKQISIEVPTDKSPIWASGQCWQWRITFLWIQLQHWNYLDRWKTGNLLWSLAMKSPFIVTTNCIDSQVRRHSTNYLGMDEDLQNNLCHLWCGWTKGFQECWCSCALNKDQRQSNCLMYSNFQCIKHESRKTGSGWDSNRTHKLIC